MIRAKLSDFKLGWVIGNFEPSILNTPNFEFAVKSYKAGEKEELHHQKIAIEVTVVVVGTCQLGSETLTAGDVIRLDPLESASFEAITDCTVAAIKTPSLPSDKVLGSA